jgi:hypothetical protein
MTRKQSTFLNNKYWLNQNIDRDFYFDVWGVKETKQKNSKRKKNWFVYQQKSRL